MGKQFARIDRATVLGAFAATGSKDPDVLDARRAALLAEVGYPRRAGTVVLVLGLSLLAISIGRLPGGVLVVVGLWLRRRGAANAAVVEQAFAEHIGWPAKP